MNSFSITLPSERMKKSRYCPMYVEKKLMRKVSPHGRVTRDVTDSKTNCTSPQHPHTRAEMRFEYFKGMAKMPTAIWANSTVKNSDSNKNEEFILASSDLFEVIEIG